MTLAGVDISSRPRLLDRVAELRRAQPSGSPAAARIFSAAITMENIVADDVERAIVLARSALKDGQIFRELPLESPPVTLAINALAFADRDDEALAAWEHVLSAARHRGPRSRSASRARSAPWYGCEWASSGTQRPTPAPATSC